MAAAEAKAQPSTGASGLRARRSEAELRDAIGPMAELRDAIGPTVMA